MSDTPRADADEMKQRREYDDERCFEWPRFGAVADFNLCRQLERELADATAENTRLRAALANSSGACVYCSLPKDQWVKCSRGFPGCARADDAMGCPELGARIELEQANARIRRLEEAGDAMATYAHIIDFKNWKEAKETKP